MGKEFERKQGTPGDKVLLHHFLTTLYNLASDWAEIIIWIILFNQLPVHLQYVFGVLIQLFVYTKANPLIVFVSFFLLYK